jgi:hypothetical protein
MISDILMQLFMQASAGQGQTMGQAQVKRRRIGSVIPQRGNRCRDVYIY